MPGQAELTISSRNYSSWSLRGWLLLRWSGLPFKVISLAADDAQARAELLQQTSSVRIPSLRHDGIEIWDVMAMAEYLHEIRPQAGLYPEDAAARARCRTVSAEMHAGFASLRSALPVNLRLQRHGFPIWSGVRADVERVCDIFRWCLGKSGGPFLFGARPTVADAMFAPVCTRFATYGVEVDAQCAAFGALILALPDMLEWAQAARGEPDLVSELEVEGEF